MRPLPARPSSAPFRGARLAILAGAVALACQGSSPTGVGSGPEAPVTIQLTPGQVELAPGASQRFVARPLDGAGRPVAAALRWGAAGGTIRPDGLFVAGAAAGEFLVTVEAGPAGDAVRASALVQVAAAGPLAPPGVPATVAVAPASAEVRIGDSLRFTAVVRDARGTTLPSGVSWRASGGAIRADGTFVPGAETGAYEVTATAGTALGRAGVQVAPRPAPTDPARLAIAPLDAELLPGDSLRFTATLTDGLGRPAAGPIGWQAGGGTISNSGQYVAGAHGGTFVVLAWSGALQATAVVRIAGGSPSPGPGPDPDPELDPDPGPLPGPSPPPPPAPPPPPPPPPPAPPAPPLPPGTIRVATGQSLQALIDAHPAGTTFRLAAGVHRRQSVVPKDDSTFEGEPGAVMDGEGAVEHAFRGDFNRDTADRITIRGLEIRNYASPLKTGAIRAGGPVAMTTGWVVERCDVHDNDGGGIRLGDRMIVRDSRIHHNGQIGIVGDGDDVLIDGNEIDHNNTRDIRHTVGLWEFGGTKFAGTRNLVLRDNYVHDNLENGLWLDVGTVGSLIENNRVIDNSSQGIMIEVSYRVTVRGNRVEGNGFGRAGNWLYGAGILVSSTPDVEIYGNTVRNNARGIIAIQQNRGSGTLGPHEVRNLYVHDNVVTMEIGWTGIGDDTGTTAVFTSRNNRFVDNTYHLGPESHYFVWMHAKRTEAAWQGFGNDVNGEFHR